MATYNSVYVLTRYANIDNASKKSPNDVFRVCNGKVYRKVWSGAMRGKMKEYISTHKVYEEHYGENWNGFGYQDKFNNFFLNSEKDFLQLVEGKATKPKTVKTWSQVRDTWAKRLVRLLANCNGYEWVTMDVARSIAEEKNDYKRQQIEKVEAKQYDNYSTKRATLIHKMERENPLRRIEDEQHAIAIIQASHRHNNSNYEHLLDEYRHEAELGLIDRSEVKDKARMNMNFDTK